VHSQLACTAGWPRRGRGRAVRVIMKFRACLHTAWHCSGVLRCGAVIYLRCWSWTSSVCFIFVSHAISIYICRCCLCVRRLTLLFYTVHKHLVMYSLVYTHIYRTHRCRYALSDRSRSSQWRWKPAIMVEHCREIAADAHTSAGNYYYIASRCSIASYVFVVCANVKSTTRTRSLYLSLIVFNCIIIGTVAATKKLTVCCF